MPSWDCWRWVSGSTISKGGDLRRFYTTQHQFSGGLNWHARTMVPLSRKPGWGDSGTPEPAGGTSAIAQDPAPYRTDLVVCVEGLLTWYWLANLCAREGISFVLGHAL
jgi:hypothetical protein